MQNIKQPHFFSYGPLSVEGTQQIANWKIFIETCLWKINNRVTFAKVCLKKNFILRLVTSSVY